MASDIDRRDFIKKSLITPAAGALAGHAAHNQASAGQAGSMRIQPGSKASLPMGRIKDLQISRMLLALRA